MEFCSSLFLYTFLPLSVLAFWLAPKKAKTGVLLAFNLLFGVFAGLWRGLALVLCPLLSYGAARWMERMPSLGRRKVLAALLSLFYGLLLAGSFWRQWTEAEKGLSLLLPLYFSSFFLRSVAFLWDAAKKELPARFSFFPYLTYQTLFFLPTGGPIPLYQQCAGNLISPRCSWDSLSQGLRRLIEGLGKMLILAAGLLEFWAGCLENQTLALL